MIVSSTLVTHTVTFTNTTTFTLSYTLVVPEVPENERPAFTSDILPVYSFDLINTEDYFFEAPLGHISDPEGDPLTSTRQRDSKASWISIDELGNTGSGIFMLKVNQDVAIVGTYQMKLIFFESIEGEVRTTSFDINV